MDPLFLLAIIPIGILVVLFGNKVSFKAFGVTLSFSKKEDKLDLHALRHLIGDHYALITKFNDNILKNEMLYSEGKMSEIATQLVLESDKRDVQIVYHVVHSYIKKTMLENGFAGYEPAELHKYITNKITELRVLYKEYLDKSAYIDSHSFANDISDIYTHACHTVRYWTDKIIEAENAYDLAVKKYGG